MVSYSSHQPESKASTLYQFFLSCCFFKYTGFDPTSWEVMGSILAGVFGIFHKHSASVCTVTQGSAHSLTDMSTRSISSGVKATGVWDGRYHLRMPIV